LVAVTRATGLHWSRDAFYRSSDLWLFIGSELVAALAGLLLAWAVVPGARVRNAFGLFLAAILLVGFRYAGMALLPAVIGLGQ